MSTLDCEEPDRPVSGASPALLLLDGDALQRVAFFDRVDHVLPVGHVAEHGVLAVKVRLRRPRDEELTAVRVGARIRHREDARLVREWVAVDLVVELVPRSAPARTGGVAALYHEALNDPVERRAVVEALVGEEGEVVDRVGGVLGIELSVDRALAGLEGRLVDGVRVDLEVGRVVPLRMVGHGEKRTSAKRQV